MGNRAGFLPGAVLIIAKWYIPSETQTRIAILYTSAASGGAFSGLLAFGIAKMDGIAGIEGWRWVCDSLPPYFSIALLTDRFPSDIHRGGSFHDSHSSPMLFSASGLPRALIWMAYTRRDSLPGSAPDGKHYRKLAQERNGLENPSQRAH